ncbi:hypothetical protein GCM10009838_29940 [Catenulispora subtropica]|uniref:Uncharacterized protein n=1 Tax=Catenulispora subtropica TaxID=450798 RepID=A0ABN2RHI0_9ACTN
MPSTVITEVGSEESINVLIGRVAGRGGQASVLDTGRRRGQSWDNGVADWRPREGARAPFGTLDPVTAFEILRDLTEVTAQ